jgi:hypothetical protein
LKLPRMVEPQSMIESLNFHVKYFFTQSTLRPMIDSCRGDLLQRIHAGLDCRLGRPALARNELRYHWLHPHVR